MNIFRLPDLGEGLPDAEIHKWHVKVGDSVKTDDLIVSMETAKAVVDVPAPCDGVIAKLHGNEGDVIDTDAPLIEFESSDTKADSGIAWQAHVGGFLAGFVAVAWLERRLI